MPTLPDFTSLGQAPTLRPSPAVGDYPSAAIPEFRADTRNLSRQQIALAEESARGGQVLGENIQKAALAGLHYFGEEQKAKNHIALINAKTDFILQKNDLDESQKQETDPGRIAHDYPAAYQTAALAVGSTLPEHLRPEFNSWAALHVGDGVAKANSRVKSIVDDTDIANISEKLNKLRQTGLTTTDPVMTAEIIKQAGDLIDTGVAKGYWDKNKAFASKETWTNNFSKAWVGMQPDDVQVRLLRPTNVNQAIKDGVDYYQSQGWQPHQAAGIMAHFLHESGGRLDPNAINRGDGSDGSDSIGIGQWNGSRAIELKKFAASQGKPWNDLGVQLAFAQHEFNTSESKAASAIKQSNSIDEAVSAGLKYERPQGFEGGLATAKGGSQRLRYGREIFGQINGSGSPIDTRIASLIDPSEANAMASDAENRIAKQNAQAEHAARVQIATNNALEAVRSGLSINPYDNDGKKTLDLAYGEMTARGADPAAVMAEIVDKTKALPPAASSGIRMGINSDDPTKVAQSAGIAINLMARNNAIFDPDPGAKDIQEAASKFQHYIDYRGLTSDEAAKKIIQERDPAYKEKMKKQADTYGFNKDIADDEKNGALLSDLEKHFGSPSFFGLRTSPAQIAFREGDRQAAIEDYKSLIRDNFDNNGDYKLSRSLAQNQLNRVWGVTNINGREVAMRFPPEQAPALRYIPNVSDRIAEQIQAEIKSYTGHDVDRATIELQPIEGGVTSKAYWSNQPPPYQVFWTDKNGIRQALNPGLAFVPDVNALHEAGRQQGLSQASNYQSRALPPVNSLAAKF